MGGWGLPCLGLVNTLRPEHPPQPHPYIHAEKITRAGQTDSLQRFHPHWLHKTSIQAPPWTNSQTPEGPGIKHPYTLKAPWPHLTLKPIKNCWANALMLVCILSPRLRSSDLKKKKKKGSTGKRINEDLTSQYKLPLAYLKKFPSKC